MLYFHWILLDSIHFLTLAFVIVWYFLANCGSYSAPAQLPAHHQSPCHGQLFMGRSCLSRCHTSALDAGHCVMQLTACNARPDVHSASCSEQHALRDQLHTLHQAANSMQCATSCTLCIMQRTACNARPAVHSASCSGQHALRDQLYTLRHAADSMHCSTTCTLCIMQRTACNARPAVHSASCSRQHALRDQLYTLHHAADSMHCATSCTLCIMQRTACTARPVVSIAYCTKTALNNTFMA